MRAYSEVPKAVDAWRGDLESKNRPKIAAGIVHPKDNAALFDEGWEQALSREASLSASMLLSYIYRTARLIAVNLTGKAASVLVDAV